MATRLGMSVFAACIALFVVSCDYGHRQYRPSTGPVSTSGASMVVEVDDFGRFWDREAANATLDEISGTSLNRNTVVLVFIHGWHHNAAETDENVQNFQNTLRHVRDTISKPEYIEVRKLLNLNEDLQVMGLYVGWRGRSLPGWLDYLTFWGRKSTAERVGDGDLREFFVKLQNIYMQRNEHPDKTKTYMGLVTVGHSFGGQVLFKAIAEALENDLTKAVARAGGPQPGKPTVLSEIVSGLGDMTVLLNPALEAFQFERIDRLTTQTSFHPFQTPVILTISAEDDRARKIWFPVGRTLNLPFRPMFPNDDVKQLWLRALGEYEPQRTHTLETTDQPSSVSDALYRGCQIQKVDFTDTLTLNGSQLKPNGSHNVGYSPVVVAYTSNKLIQEHSGIFGETFRDFLTDYVAFIQGKRMCLIRGGQSSMN